MSDDSHEYDEDALEFIEDERVRIAALHATCPKQIWLQVDPEAEQFDGWEAQTWCSDKINETDVRYVLAASRDAEIAELVGVLGNVTAHLVAAHSLLSRGGKKAAASDTIFKIMLQDYEKSFEAGRKALAKVRKP